MVSHSGEAIHEFDEYGLRFVLEENFLDDKSNGFQLESSLLCEVLALTCLCLLLATVTLCLVSTRVSVVTLGWRRMVDSHWQRGLSYFKLGWRWVEYALTNHRFLLRFSRLVPGPDPEPVSASKPQDARPRASIDAITLLL